MEKAEFHQNNLESKLLEIFTSGQIKKLKIGSLKRSNWSEEDIARSITLYSSSSRGYKMLKKKFPASCYSNSSNLGPEAGYNTRSFNAHNENYESVKRIDA